MSYLGLLLGVDAELPLCRDAIGVFCSFSWLGYNYFLKSPDLQKKNSIKIPKISGNFELYDCLQKKLTSALKNQTRGDIMQNKPLQKEKKLTLALNNPRGDIM